MKYYLLLCIAFLACQSKVDKQQTQPLLTVCATDEQSGNITLEFMPDNTIHFKNAASYQSQIPDHPLSKPEIVKRDSFIYLIQTNKKQEFYNDIDNCFEPHLYSIFINSDSLNKKIQIAGHKAPKKYYDFIFWALSLKESGK